MCVQVSSTTDAHDTDDGFMHVWVTEPMLSVDSKVVCDGTHVSARYASVRAAARVNRVCSLQAPRSTEITTRGLIIWRAAARHSATTDAPASRSMREAHAGEPALVFVRGDGVAVIEVCTHLVTFQNWDAIGESISGAIERIALLDLPTPSSLMGMVAWARMISTKEKHLSFLVDNIVREQAYDNLRRRFAVRTIASSLDANLEAIKVKLWQPHGRLVSHMISTDLLAA